MVQSPFLTLRRHEVDTPSSVGRQGKRVHTGETYTVKGKLIGADGTELYASEAETVKVKTIFFSRLIAFFRGLLGKLPVIVQVVKENSLPSRNVVFSLTRPQGPAGGENRAGPVTLIHY